MRTYLAYTLIIITMALIPSPSTVEERCPKCDEVQCIYWEGEKLGLNEQQVETILFKLNLVK